VERAAGERGHVLERGCVLPRLEPVNGGKEELVGATGKPLERRNGVGALSQPPAIQPSSPRFIRSAHTVKGPPGPWLPARLLSSERLPDIGIEPEQVAGAA